MIKKEKSALIKFAYLCTALTALSFVGVFEAEAIHNDIVDSEFMLNSENTIGDVSESDVEIDWSRVPLEIQNYFMHVMNNSAPASLTLKQLKEIKQRAENNTSDFISATKSDDSSILIDLNNVRGDLGNYIKKGNDHVEAINKEKKQLSGFTTSLKKKLGANATIGEVDAAINTIAADNNNLDSKSTNSNSGSSDSSDNNNLSSKSTNSNSGSSDSSVDQPVENAKVRKKQRQVKLSPTTRTPAGAKVGAGYTLKATESKMNSLDLNSANSALGE